MIWRKVEFQVHTTYYILKCLGRLGRQTKRYVKMHDGPPTPYWVLTYYLHYTYYLHVLTYLPTTQPSWSSSISIPSHPSHYWGFASGRMHRPLIRQVGQHPSASLSINGKGINVKGATLRGHWVKTGRPLLSHIIAVRSRPFMTVPLEAPPPQARLKHQTEDE